MKELDFIEWIRSQGGMDSRAVPVGPGDDMAVVACGSEKVLVTVDQVLDGVHFVLSAHGPRAAGRKAMARSLSDVAAMAAVPLGAVASVALPKGFARADAEAIYHGMRSAADAFGCPVVGGDVGTWTGALAVSVTVFARPSAVKPVLRSGAKAGDAVCVTGQLGGAWHGRRHLEFTPRINEAIALAGRCELHAMIDVSDGLAADLAHLCEASGVGAVIQAADVPIHEDARAHCPDDPLKAALYDGEDYELLFALSAAQADKLIAKRPGGIAVIRIGEIVAEGGLSLVDAQGAREPIQPGGWEHET